MDNDSNKKEKVFNYDFEEDKLEKTQEIDIPENLMKDIQSKDLDQSVPRPQKRITSTNKFILVSAGSIILIAGLIFGVFYLTGRSLFSSISIPKNTTSTRINTTRRVSTNNNLNATVISNVDETPEKSYEDYSKIELGMTLDETTTISNDEVSSEEPGAVYEYVSSNPDVYYLITVDSDNKVVDKSFSDNNGVILKPNSDNFEKLSWITQRMPYEEVKNILGSDGYNTRVNSDLLFGGYKEFEKEYTWVFNDKSKLIVDFVIQEDKPQVYSFHIDDSNKITLDNSGVNYENFLNINENMKIDEIIELLKGDPVITYSENGIKYYTFNDLISVSYDNTGSLIYKFIDEKKIEYPSSAKASFHAFLVIVQGMNIKDVETIIGSKGLLVRQVFIDKDNSLGYKNGYSWILDADIREDGRLIFLTDDKDQLVSAISMGDEISEYEENIFDIINRIELGMSLQDVEAIIGHRGLIFKSSSIDTFAEDFTCSSMDIRCYFNLDYRLSTIRVETINPNLFESNSPDSNKINEIRNGMSYDEVKAILGSDGYLCNKMSYGKGYIWIFDDKKCIMVDFSVSNTVIDIKIQ